MEIDPVNVQNAVLEMGTDDYTGLYELLWWLDGKYPEASIAQKYKAADEAIGHLLREGLIELYRETQSKTDIEHTILSRQDIESVLRTSTSWCPGGHGDEVIVVAATDRGEKHHYHGSQDSAA